MSIESADSRSEQAGLIVETLSKSAIQAVYHAATGKTENQATSLKGNCIVTLDDIENLHHVISDQVTLLKPDFGPTVTVVTKSAKSKVTTYSSWERFRALRTGDTEVTSEVNLKYEFVFSAGDSGRPQRCIINITIDSGLPFLSDEDFFENPPPPAFFVFFLRDWESVKISVDFVDYVAARNLIASVEEWFSTLNRIKRGKFDVFLVKNSRVFSSVIERTPLIGLAVFMLIISYREQSDIYIKDIIEFVGIGMLLYSVLDIFSGIFQNRVFRQMFMRVVPTIIELTKADKEAFKKINSNTPSLNRTILLAIIALSSNVFANVLAAYAVMWLK